MGMRLAPQSTVTPQPSFSFALEKPMQERFQKPNTGNSSKNRFDSRLEGFGIYSIISTLLGTMANMMLNTTSSQVLMASWWPLRCVYITSLSISMLSALYSAIIFSMAKMYGHTAVGLNRDNLGLEFMRKTLLRRQRAFFAYCTSIASFTLAFVLSSWVRLGGNLAAVNSAVSLPIVAFIWMDCYKMYRAASCIFR